MSERRKCDLVMQGGVTSGVVYPGVVCKLAEEYDFQSIGGTSAGAIAAALTGAAEFARRNGDAKAFDKLNDVSTWLGSKAPGGKKSNLFALFQPQPGTRGLFRLATAFLIKGKLNCLLAVAAALWIELLLALLPPIGLTLAGWNLRGPRFLACAVLTAALALTCIACVAVAGIVVRAWALPRRFFGLCTGYAAPRAGRPPSLVNWLDERINEIAGMRSDRPLTFGDLKRQGTDLGQGINLQMMTTCLTWGRPFTLPFQSRDFWFSPAEWQNFFPPSVVNWMVQCSRDEKEEDPTHTADSDSPRPINTAGLCRLPDADDLPVIVAARLSLSFPLLFCAVPLYAVDHSLRQCKPGEPDPQCVPGGAIPVGGSLTPEHVWFTDGGICNNFPLHLFDKAVPHWPTFAIDLVKQRPDRPDERTWMPNFNGGGIHTAWTRLDSKRGLSGVAALIIAIVDTARSWVNSLQATAPGYRDRIVQIRLSKQEGGLNLNMSEEDLENLRKYGHQAAEHLIDHFIRGEDGGKPTRMTWNNHRWIRYRSTMSLLEKFLDEFARGIQQTQAGDVPYWDLIQRKPGDPPPTGYRFTVDEVPHAVAETADLVRLGNLCRGHALERGSAHPEPALVIRPNF